MSIVKSIVKNTAVLYIGSMVLRLLSFALLIYMARILGDVILGKYSFALSLAAILGVFISLGFDTLIIRDVARDKNLAPKYIGNIAIIKAILAIIFYGFLVLAIKLMDYPPDTTTAIFILGAYMVLTALANIFRVTFRTYERMEYEVLVHVLSRMVSVSLALTALFLGYGLIEIAYAFLIGGFTDLLLGFFICNWKFVRFKFTIDLNFWKKATRASLPLTFITIAAIIYTRTDIVMLSIMKGDEVVGWYNAAHNLLLSVSPIAGVFATALLPVMTRLFTTSISSLKFVYEKSCSYLLMVSLPLAVGIMLLSTPIVDFFYGSEFVHSVIILRILAWNIVLGFLNAVLFRVLISINRENQIVVAGVICAILNVILNLILIPHFSYIGAAIATVVTLTVLFGLNLYFVSKYLYRLPLHRIAIKPILAAAVMAIFIYFSSGLNLVTIIIIAVVIYFAVLFIIKGFTKEDRDLIAKIIPKWRKPWNSGRKND